MTLRPLHVIDGLHPRYGGPPRVAVGLACQLAAQGLAPEVLSLCAHRDEAETLAAWPELAKARVPVHLLCRAPPSQLGWAPTLGRFYRRRLKDFDVVHIHGIWSHALAYSAKLARIAGIPYVVASHGMLDRWSMARSRAKKILAMTFFGVGDMLRRTDGIQFGTIDEAEEARHLALGTPEFAIPNGIDPALFERVAEEGTAKLLGVVPGLAGRFPVVLFLGRFHPKKGIDLLCEAFARVGSEYPDAALLVLGIPQDKDYESRLLRRAQERDLVGRVFMTSKLLGREALQAVKLAHLFVMPSYQEGFSIAILEALAYGLPVLATTPCHMSALDSVGAGRVVDATVDGVAEGLRWFLARDASELAEMAKRGKSWVETDFSWHAVGAKVEAMYRTVRERRNGHVR
jgi:glycosyltransferase involved in cell wall biosynthesis